MKRVQFVYACVIDSPLRRLLPARAEYGRRDAVNSHCVKSVFCSLCCPFGSAPIPAPDTVPGSGKFSHPISSSQVFKRGTSWPMCMLPYARPYQRWCLGLPQSRCCWTWSILKMFPLQVQVKPCSILEFISACDSAETPGRVQLVPITLTTF